MERKTVETGPAKQANARDARLKAALKANLQRRKTQAKARADSDDKKTDRQDTR